MKKGAIKIITNEPEKQAVSSRTLIDQGRKQGMVQGICLALSYSFRSNSEHDIWKASGLSIEECEEAEVDEFDMEMIRKHFGEKVE